MTAQTDLKEPDQMNWDEYHVGGKFRRPPVPVGPDGKLLTFYVQIPQNIEEGQTQEGYKNFLLDPLVLVRSGEADGTEIRFTRVSVKKFTNRRTGKVVDASMVGNLLRAAGLTLKPQTNPEYSQAVNATRGLVIPINLDWYARDKTTQTVVRGYKNFPDDPERPGQKKAILTTGDAFIDSDGMSQTFGGEIMFANPELKYFVDVNRKRA